MDHCHQRIHIELHGAVQGVGFRPFVYRLATELRLSGWVTNTTRGVVLEVEGMPAHLHQFLERLGHEKPALAIISDMQTTWMHGLGGETFHIRDSERTGHTSAMLLPDIAPCAACLHEMCDPHDRRYRYPFINCTNCGPRFSIIEGLPYDRPSTTMKAFEMCPQCHAEYRDPRDRRFHAQPDACAVCGPYLFLLSEEGDTKDVTGWAAMQATVDALQEGFIVALKGVGGFHLLVDACNDKAVACLRERKQRGDKPFALLVRDIAQAHQCCTMSAEEEALLVSSAAPIVLMPVRAAAEDVIRVSAHVAPGSRYLGLMLPPTPLHHLLMHELQTPVVATSGNRHDEPICTDESVVWQQLGTLADRFVAHNRPIVRHVDDSVAWVVAGQPQLLRRARGYAPLPVSLADEVPTMLAMGAHQKAAIALSIGKHVFLSQHIGDLETLEAIAAYERVIGDFLRLYGAHPRAIVHDLHPDYLSTSEARRWADSLSPRPVLIPVQHHHAHLAACLAENHCTERALGVTWDGTGYGTDGTIWGGEFLLGDCRSAQRVASLRPFRLLGGDMARHEPWRVGMSLLWEMYGAAAFDYDDLEVVQMGHRHGHRTLQQMLTRGINAPLTSSMGRLFDGIAALLGLHQHVSFEGQAAMALEQMAEAGISEGYPIDIVENRGGADTESPMFLIDWRPLVAALLDERRRGGACERVSAKFHRTLVDVIGTIAHMVNESRVVLTGGCFQNRLLIEDAVVRLRAAGFDVLVHHHVPPNDGGICLGQIAIAAACHREEGGR